MRCFTALSLPGEICRSVQELQKGLDGQRWQARENFHITLRFLDEVRGAQLKDLREELQSVTFDAFPLSLKGVDFFGKADNPKLLYVAVEPSEALSELKLAVDHATRQAGIALERQAGFVPHVTLSRLKRPHGVSLARYLEKHAFFRSECFWIEEFHLYSSHLGEKGASYFIEDSYEANGCFADPDDDYGLSGFVPGSAF
ncbi:RNA 2',3'-cyclic phosphodiesterase [Kiloniella sp. b19]|uniref:RNA 2',3'-cyclic phosphodiesterase n=1 Tax=Kiloniella sp. GXU_MW_B19 TaxID=3141326 RepID=UPI0031D337A5